MVDYLGFAVLLVLLVLFGWLVTRSWRNRNPVLKWITTILTGLFTLIFVAATVLAVIGTYQLNVSPYSYPVTTDKVTATADQIALGKRYAQLCAGCHSSTGQLPLDGSKDDFLGGGGGPPVGTLYPPNLTPAGPLKDWSDADIIRAIREGVDKNGRPLLIMPSPTFHKLSDTDVESLVAYIRSQPPVQHATPATKINVIGAIVIALGVFQTSAQPPITSPIVAPQTGTVEYGKYVAGAFGCQGCHGPDLNGSSQNGPPVSANLTVVVPNWSQEQFLQVFKTGVDPTGHKIDPNAMPWKDFGAGLTDSQLNDLYSYLHTLKPLPQGK
jgi:mono/diheme cytochrome c family protein